MPAWSKVRNSYPALKEYTYLDTAGTGVVSVSTARAARKFYEQVSNHGNVKLKAWLERVGEARRQIALLIGAKPEEVAFVANTSHGMNIAALMLKGQGEVLTNESEFPTSTVPWLHQGYKVHFVRATRGVIQLESTAGAAGRAGCKSASTARPLSIREAMGRRKRGIIVHSYVQFATGFRQDMAALGRLARRHGHHFVANITQGCGAFPVDVKEWGADIACCSGIKWMCAGEGAGFMYIRRGLLKKFKAPLAGWFSVKDPMRIDNRTVRLKTEAARFELGGLPMPSIFALGCAAEQTRRLGVGNIAGRIRGLTDYLLERLEEIDVPVASSKAPEHRSGIVLVRLPGAGALVEKLRKRKVRVSARSAGIRVSLHFYNNRDDIDAFINHLGRLVSSGKRCPGAGRGALA